MHNQIRSTQLRKTGEQQMKLDLKTSELKRATVGFIAEDGKLFITISYNRSFNFENAFGPIDKFFNMILQGVHGGHWKRRVKRRQQLKVEGMFEDDGENVHLHATVYGEAAELRFIRRHCDTVWKKLHQHGDCLTTRTRDPQKVAFYSTKDYSNEDSQAKLYVYVFPKPPEVDNAGQKRRSTPEQRRSQIWANKQERSIGLHGKVSDTKKNRAKAARYAKAKGR
jgi:hypothetical protein